MGNNFAEKIPFSSFLDEKFRVSYNQNKKLNSNRKKFVSLQVHWFINQIYGQLFKLSDRVNSYEFEMMKKNIEQNLKQMNIKK